MSGKGLMNALAHSRRTEPVFGSYCPIGGETIVPLSQMVPLLPADTQCVGQDSTFPLILTIEEGTYNLGVGYTLELYRDDFRADTFIANLYKTGAKTSIAGRGTTLAHAVIELVATLHRFDKNLLPAVAHALSGFASRAIREVCYSLSNPTESEDSL
jgi:hypothetical protein